MKDEVFKENVKRIIRKVNIEFSEFDKQLRWEMCKIKIKNSVQDIQLMLIQEI